MAYKIGVTSGLHYVARSEELATIIKKLGFGLTRGTTSIEIALDVPHEVTDTDGRELRKIAEKQGVDVLMHGSLTIPMGIPERSDWRDAQDHIEKSFRSSVKSGAKYVDFHACLNIWLELMTYTSRKLTMSFCDHEGHFISKILKESEPLRKWFIKHKGEVYARDILDEDERTQFSSQNRVEFDKWLKDEIQSRLSEAGFEQRAIDSAIQVTRFPELGVTKDEQEAIFDKYRENGQLTAETVNKAKKEIAGLEKEREESTKKGRKILEEINNESIIMNSKISGEGLDDALDKKLSSGGRWDSEELRAAVGILDGYHIMAHYMFYEKDPMWVEMARFYPILTDKYKMDYNDPEWLHEAWRQAEEDNDRVFKEFFYGAVGAKYLEGHMKKMLEWRDKILIPKELAGNRKLQQIAKDLIIGIEMPDARDAQHAGLHLLWSTRQIYVAVKMIRKVLNTDSVWMLADFEHVATQGVDPVLDMEEVIKLAPDIGSLCISVHANAPNPSHAHEPLELGDIRVYKLLYYLIKTGFGNSGRDVYVIYERGVGSRCSCTSFF